MPSVRIEGITTLRRAAKALKTVDRELRSTVKQHVNSIAREIWADEISAKPVPTSRGGQMLKEQSTTAKAYASGSVTYTATTRAESAGLEYQWWDFGSRRTRVEQVSAPVYGRKPKRPYERHVQKQLPTFIKKGRRWWHIQERAIPRTMSAIVQTTIRTISDALEGK